MGKDKAETRRDANVDAGGRAGGPIVGCNWGRPDRPGDVEGVYMSAMEEGRVEGPDAAINVCMCIFRSDNERERRRKAHGCMKPENLNWM